MLLAAGAGPGGLGFVIFVAFIIAAVAIFLAMTRSMRRLRAHVDRGDFGTTEAGPGETRSGDEPDGPGAPPSGR
jgi:hypothetical protein